MNSNTLHIVTEDKGTSDLELKYSYHGNQVYRPSGRLAFTIKGPETPYNYQRSMSLTEALNRNIQVRTESIRGDNRQ